MRILSGKYRGREIHSSRDRSIRPTTAKIKEYIFQLLGEEVQQARTLDLFSGSGGLGFEALSRGAGSVTFVDKAPRSLKVLRSNLDKLKIDEPCQTVNRDVLIFLRQNITPFDLIFADPPFPWDEFDKMLPQVFTADNLTEQGIFVLENERSHTINWDESFCRILRQKQFDRSIITFASRRHPV